MMKISSSAFLEGSEIPTQYTCEGENISPPLAWAEVPLGTKSLCLIVDDPDAPDPAAPKMVWVHWILYNIEPHISGLEENMTQDNLPAGVSSGMTSWNNFKYGGPCPPIGRHRYYHKLYALDTKLDLNKPDKDTLLNAMRGHVLGEAVLMGTYQKHH